MEDTIKRLGLLLVILLTLLMAVCSPFDPDDLKDKYTNVEYSEDGSSITIYMNGSAPVPANRALSNKLAQLGHDFFEVTFLYNDASTYRIARASWELGEPAGVNDVYRTDGGNIYYNTTNPLGDTTFGLPAADEGLVVLFVGRKSDKTLLAVGTLSEINGTTVSTTNNKISTSTTKIKFNVNALKAGMSFSYDTSSINTTSNPRTGNIDTIMVGNKSFPHFNVPVSVTTNATYTFGFHTSTLTSPATTVDFNFYAPAIKYGAGNAECWNIRPQYTLPPNIVKNNSDYPYSSAIAITITSPTAQGTPFTGQVRFDIRPTATDGVICALAFQVPVYAVYKRTTPVSGETEPVQWYIRPGYNMYYRELDNGEMENGGAVLISAGTIQAGQSFGIIMDGEPLKYMNDGDAPNTYGRSNFTLKGMEFFFKLSGSSTTALITSGMSNYPNAYGWTDIQFYFDNGTPPDYNANLANPSAPTSNLDDIAETPINGAIILPYGLVKIKMEYTYNSQIYSYMFYVEVNNISTAVGIAYENRFFILKAEDYTDAWNRMTNGNYLFVFAENLNLPEFKGNLKGNVEVFMVATVPGITIGREAGTAQTKFNTGANNYNVNIYLGKWPFNSPAFAGGDVITNELFRVSSRGTWENYAGGTTNTDMFILDGGSGRVRINVLAGIDVSSLSHIGPLGP